MSVSAGKLIMIQAALDTMLAIIEKLDSGDYIKTDGLLLSMAKICHAYVVGSMQEIIKEAK